MAKKRNTSDLIAQGERSERIRNLRGFMRDYLAKDAERMKELGRFYSGAPSGREIFFSTNLHAETKKAGGVAGKTLSSARGLRDQNDYNTNRNGTTKSGKNRPRKR